MSGFVLGTTSRFARGRTGRPAAASHGFRAMAHDRRGHGRSTQTWHGHELDTYADDLAELIEQLDLHDAVIVGHSTGGGEVTRYLGRHGTARVAKAVLLDCIKAFSETLKSAELVNDATLRVYAGAPHGLVGSYEQAFNADLLAFITAT